MFRAYEYNNLGHLTEVNEARTSGPTLTTAYTYDLAGNVLTITLPSGRVITYTRNANGQVSGVSGIVNAGSVQFASSVTYAPFGPVTGMTYGNSRTFSATFDQDYNPTNRTVSTIYNNTYDTDDNGNIIQIGGTDYGYDALNRLDEEDSGSATTYTYDAASNRLTKVAGSTTSTTVPATSNKISAVGGSSITYDSSGNYLTSGTSSYTWNAASQLATALVSGTPVGTYTYNASNQRTKKVAGGNTTQYVYGLNGLLYGEYTNAGALIREYVYLNDAPLAQIDAGTPEVLTYLHPDHLGTPRYGTNTGGTQVWAANADAFGVGTPSGSATVNLRMPGQYYDSESGLFYNWNRYYNPAIGRYISSDPIGLDGGLNTFNYADVSPVMFTDPEGFQSLYVTNGPIMMPGVSSPVVPGSPANKQFVKAAEPKVRNALDQSFLMFICPSCVYNMGGAQSNNPTQTYTPPVNSCPVNSTVWDDIDPDGAKGLHPNPPVSGPPNDPDDCELEWESAYRICEKLIGNGSAVGITAGYTSLRDCARGLVSLRCGGNKI